MFAKFCLALCMLGILCQLVHMAPVGIEQQPKANSYFVRIDQPNGGHHIELVELTEEGPKRFGNIYNIYEDGTLLVHYEAGKQGFVAKYSYKQGPPMPAPPLGVSAAALKSGTG